MDSLSFDGKNTNEVLKSLVQKMLEMLMDEERTDHLGYQKGIPSPVVRENHRNGYYGREYLSQLGLMDDLKIPRDRLGEFVPKLLDVLDRRSGKVNDLVVSMYKKGMSQRDITDIIDEIYDKKISATTVSTMAKAVTVEREAWEKRALESRYIVIFIDAIHINVRKDGLVATDAFYIIYGITDHGRRDVIGLYGGTNESATAWEDHIRDIQNRGVREVLLFVMDGLTQLTETVKAVFPNALTQRCIIHQIRQTLNAVRVKHKAEVADDLKTIYRSKSVDEALVNLKKVQQKWRSIYPRLWTTWEQYLPEFMAFLHFPSEVHRHIYTTNWLERLNKELRKVVKTKNSFPTEESVLNVLYSKLIELQIKWGERRLQNFDACKVEIDKLWDQRYPRPIGTVTQSS